MRTQSVLLLAALLLSGQLLFSVHEIDHLVAQTDAECSLCQVIENSSDGIAPVAGAPLEINRELISSTWIRLDFASADHYFFAARAPPTVLPFS